ncbi:MAG: hypothetical protein JSS57_08355 [Proteobacteria bacterium]|nr:hypothetical protein [Pseudomonadota bacterium]
MNKATALTAALAASVAFGAAHAADNPFAAKPLAGGYQLAQADTKMQDGKCGEGKCGADKKATRKSAHKAETKMNDKMAMDKKADGSCGADKKADGSCGADKKK